MILSDLLGIPVVDADGKQLGLIVDTRFVIDGTPHQLLADARLYGIIVGRHAKHSFMGYERNNENAPAPIARFLRWRERGSFLILWADIARLHPDRVELRQHHTRYSPGID